MRSHNSFTMFTKRALPVAFLCLLCVLLTAVAQTRTASALPDAAKQVRVGVAVPALGSGVSTAPLSCESGFSVGVSSSDGRAYEARTALPVTSLLVKPKSANRIDLCDGRSGEVLYTHDSAQLLAIRGAGGRAITLDRNGTEYVCPGFLEFGTDDSALRVVNVVELETYVKCVMSTEIGTNHTGETRRAFSVLVRTVPMTPKHTKHGCDVCASSCCQVYRGIFRPSEENDALVDSTAGMIVTYQGEPIRCHYHDGDGGVSCSSVAAWGGSEVPYLKSVFLPEGGDMDVEVWQHVFTKKELFDFLSSRAAFRGIEGGIESVEIAETDPYGSSYVTLLSVTDAHANTVNVATSDKVRTALRFDSANFTISYTMETTVVSADGAAGTQVVSGYVDADGVYRAFDSFAAFPLTGSDRTVGADHIVFDGVGTGHGVGFSIAGADRLSAEGYSYRYLLSFYFEGTEISKLR